jgi:hypothetical protein
MYGPVAQESWNTERQCKVNHASDTFGAGIWSSGQSAGLAVGKPAIQVRFSSVTAPIHLDGHCIPQRFECASAEILRYNKNHHLIM